MENKVIKHIEEQLPTDLVIKQEMEKPVEPFEFIDMQVDMEDQSNIVQDVKIGTGFPVKQEEIGNSWGGSRIRCVRCELCYKTYKTKSTLMRHKASAHGKMCTSCHKIFNSKQSLTQHYHQHECEVCYKVYRAKTVLSEHMRKVHGITATDNGQIQKCNICEKEFKSKSYLHLHEKRSKCSRFIVKVKPEIVDDKEEEQFGASSMSSTCDYCNKVLKNKQAVKVHIIRIHIKDAHGCDICDKVFKCKEYLLRHSVLVHGRALYECALCNKAYKAQYVLTAHMKYAHGHPAYGQMFRCDMCLKVFPYKSYLLRHETKCTSLVPADIHDETYSIPA